MTKIKQWLGIAAGVITAILLVLAGAKASNKRQAAKRKEERAVDLLNSGISDRIAKGKKLAESAQKDKDIAVKAHQKMEQRLEKLGESNEDLDAIATRFNSKRLRHKPAS